MGANYTHRATGSGVLNEQTSFPAEVKLRQITLHLSAPVYEDLTIRIKDGVSVVYDTVLCAQALGDKVDFIFIPDEDIELAPCGDQFLVELTNAAGAVWGLKIVAER